MTAVDGVVHEVGESERRPATSRSRQALQVVVSLALVAGVAWYVKSQVADFSDVWRQIRDMTGLELVVLGALAAWNLVTYWLVVVAATPGLSYPQAMVLTQCTTAVSNTLPAGSAVAVGLTYAMLSSWGFSKSRSTVSILVTGVWNNFVKLGMPIVALAVLVVQGDAGGGRIVAAVAGTLGLLASLVVFALILRSEDFASRAGTMAGTWVSSVRRRIRRGPVRGWDLAVTKFRARVVGLVQRRWVRLTVSAVVGHLSLYAVLLVALRQIGVSEHEVPWAEVLAVFAFARLLTAIPVTPGGIGVIELALISGLTAAGGDDAGVVAAVLVYRGLTYLVPILFGLCTYLFWRRNHSWLDSAPALASDHTSAAQR